MESPFHSQFQTKQQIFQKYFGEDWSFSDGFSEQLKKIEAVSKNQNLVYVLSGVHQPVFTLGNSLKKLLSSSNENFVQTDRGGRVMYHGSGQLTIYPIFRLQKYFPGPKDYIQFLLKICIDHFAKNYGVKLICKNNGLWSSENKKKNKKVGFIGLRIKNGVVYHGLSLNYDADLGAFLKHSPCDISGDQAGNLLNAGSEAVSLEKEACTLMNDIAMQLTLREAKLV